MLSSAKITQGQKGYTDLGKAGLMYRAIVTPGNLTASPAGDEVLGLTESGRLSMFSTTGLVNGTAMWTGNGLADLQPGRGGRRHQRRRLGRPAGPYPCR